MRVFVIGAHGLVGSCLRPLLRDRGHEVQGGDLPEADVTEPRRLEAWVGGARPHWIVNLAAWTDVDGCEGDPARANASNAEGAGNVARLCAARGAKMLHVSTDYVFDGRKGTPYSEEDAADPLSAYGKSKLLGESAVGEALPADRRLVVRGQSLYGEGKKSFPDAILRAAEEKPEIPVVTDQVVSPTWTRDFAEGLAALLEKGASGIVHVSAAGSCTWNEFARAVLEERGVRGARITETTAAALGRAAPRPAYSVFDLGKFERVTGIRPRPWREQLRDYLRTTGRAA